MSSLKDQFDEAMFNIYRRAKSEAHYNAKLFLAMLHEKGGIMTAKHLINAPKPSDGYTHLFEKNRLDLTVEAMLVENSKWHELFTAEEIQRAQARLVAYKYRAEARES